MVPPASDYALAEISGFLLLDGPSTVAMLAFVNSADVRMCVLVMEAFLRLGYLRSRRD